LNGCVLLVTPSLPGFGLAIGMTHLTHGGRLAVGDVQVRHRVVNIDERRGYEVVFIDAGDRHVQVTVSPTGRSIQVHVDGVKWEARRG
jgi:hypothetical protein